MLTDVVDNYEQCALQHIIILACFNADSLSNGSKNDVIFIHFIDLYLRVISNYKIQLYS